jgi:hypothetical protein
MENSAKNNKALVYCSIWPDEGQDRTLETQSIELQTYCVMRGLEVMDIVTDIGSGTKGRMRPGLERLLARVLDEGIGHIVIHDVGRIGRGSREVMAFLRDTFDAGRTEIHVTAWKMTTASAEFARTAAMAGEILALDRQTDAARDQVLRSEKIRLKPLWARMFGMLQDERYAEALIRALFQLKDTVRLSEKEYNAVHGGYDHLNMFRALGFRIKGEKTDNTKLVADVLARYWDKLKVHLSTDLHRIIEGSETASLP